MSEQGSFSIERMGQLAKLDLSVEERAKLGRDIQGILDLVDQLSPQNDGPIVAEVRDVNGVNLESIREDVPVAGLSRDQAMRNAPDSDQEHFLVPPVFE